jgi:hypothetical protein
MGRVCVCGRERASASELSNGGLPQRPDQISMHPFERRRGEDGYSPFEQGFEEMARLLRVRGRSSPQTFWKMQCDRVWRYMWTQH